jgi:hypothetical protein
MSAGDHFVCVQSVVTTGRVPNLAATNHPAWAPLLDLAKNVREQLAAFAEINRAYFERGANAI